MFAQILLVKGVVLLVIAYEWVTYKGVPLKQNFPIVRHILGPETNTGLPGRELKFSLIKNNIYKISLWH